MMKKRNLVCLYVSHHQGCGVKDIARDIDMNYSTIATSLYVAVQKGEMTSQPGYHQEYFCDMPRDVTDLEWNEYILSIIKKHQSLTREQLCKISGVSMYMVNKVTTRLKLLEKIETSTGSGIRYKQPKPPRRYMTIDEMRRRYDAR